MIISRYSNHVLWITPTSHFLLFPDLIYWSNFIYKSEFTFLLAINSSEESGITRHSVDCLLIFGIKYEWRPMLALGSRRAAYV